MRTMTQTSESTSESEGAALKALLDVLTLEQLDDNLFRGTGADNGRGRSFGGQVAAQSVMAAIGTVEDEYYLHSMHSYFLLPGDPTQPIIYDVERIRDGRSFATRRVAARQHGRDIYYQTSNFHRHEEGFEHQDRMPDVIPPEMGLDLTSLLKRAPTRGEGARRGVGCRRRTRHRQLATRSAARPRPPVASAMCSSSTGACPTTRRSSSAPSSG